MVKVMWLHCGIPKRLLAGFVVMLLALLPARFAHSGGMHFRPGRYSAFLAEETGRVLLLPAHSTAAALCYAEGAWTEYSALVWEGTIRDAIRTDTGIWLVLSQVSSEEVVVYEWTGTSFRERHRMTGLFEDPTLHDTGGGRFWVTSRMGQAYAMGPEGMEMHALGPVVKKGRSYAYYPPTLSLATANHGVWFWSHVEHEALNFGGGKRQAIDGFHVYKDGAWTVVPYTETKLGGIVEIGDGELYGGTRYKGFFRLAARDGTIEDLDWNLPKGEHCMFLHRLGHNHLLAITARPSMFMRLQPDKGGWLGTLLAIIDGNPRVLLQGVDFKKVRHDKGRPVVTAPDGVFLAAAQAGLVYVSHDAAQILRLDWRHGIPTPNIDRMYMLGDQLLLLDRSRGFAVVPWRTLLTSSAATGTAQWDEVAVAGPPTMTSDGTVWYLTANRPAVLRGIKNGKVTTYDVPESVFPAKSLWYLAADSRDRIWLLSNHETHRTAVLDKGEWHTFDLRETAYSAYAQQEKGNLAYRIGDPSQHYFPAFAGDGRVAYQNEWSRICYFDGDTWDHGYGEKKIEGRSPQGPPFYQDGVLTVAVGDSFYQNIEGHWRVLRRDIQSPYGDRPRDVHRIDLPGSFPGTASHPPIRVQDNIGTIWAGDFFALHRGLGDIWVTFPTAHTPLQMADGISDILVAADGSIFFTLTGGDYRRIAHYRPDGGIPVLHWAQPPADRVEGGTVHISVQTDTGKGTRILRARCDGRDWVQHAAAPDGMATFTFRDLASGEHTVRIQAYDALLRPAPALRHTFTVTRHYAREIALLLPQLGSEDYADRERAAQSLIMIGAPALPALQRLMEQNADMAWWVQAIRQQIDRRQSLPQAIDSEHGR